MSMGMQVAAQVAQAMLEARLRREAEEQKAGKGPSQQPGKFGRTPQTFNRGSSEAAYQAQRAGERQDYTLPGGESVSPALEPEQLSGPGMGWDMTPEMGASVFGSGTFSAADIKRGYRSLGKA